MKARTHATHHATLFLAHTFLYSNGSFGPNMSGLPFDIYHIFFLNFCSIHAYLFMKTRYVFCLKKEETYSALNVECKDANCIKCAETLKY